MGPRHIGSGRARIRRESVYPDEICLLKDREDLALFRIRKSCENRTETVRVSDRLPSLQLDLKDNNIRNEDLAILEVYFFISGSWLFS